MKKFFTIIILKLLLPLFSLVGIFSTLQGCDGGKSEITLPSQGVVSRIEVRSDPASISIDSTSTVTAKLYDAENNLISDEVSVSFSVDKPELGSISSSATTTNGAAQATFSAVKIGKVTITVTFGDIKGIGTIEIKIAPTNIELKSEPSSITIDGTSTVTATLYDAQDKPISDGMVVNFSIDNSGLGSILSSAITANGIAQTTFSAGKTQAGMVTVTANSGGVKAISTIEIKFAPTGSIEFLSATPQIISIQGSGGIATSNIQFKVKDSNGNPILSSQKVNIKLSGPNGGEYLGSVPNTFNTTVGTINGIASVILHSGNIPGTATLTASIEGTNLSTSSGVIAIGGGIPSAGHFSLSAEKFNLEGLDFDGITTKISAMIADRFGNYNVLAGTTVSFYSECGAIDRAVALDKEGKGSVIFRTQNPMPRTVDRDSCGQLCDDEEKFITKYKEYFGDIEKNARPRNGICTIVAVTDGEEEFIDNNANGIYDTGEFFVDTNDDIYIDVNDNEKYDSNELFIVDNNKNGIFDGPNDVWDNNKRISKKINMFITGEPKLVVAEKREDGKYHLITESEFQEIVAPTGNSDQDNDKGNGKRSFAFALHDANYNQPIAGTTLSLESKGQTVIDADGNECSTNGELSIDSFDYVESKKPGTEILYVTLTNDNDTGKNINVNLKFNWKWKGSTTVKSYQGILKSSLTSTLCKKPTNSSSSSSNGGS
ncbi:Invasin_D3 domain-containing protein [Gammaproteobacteria bacterium]